MESDEVKTLGDLVKVATLHNQHHDHIIALFTLSPHELIALAVWCLYQAGIDPPVLDWLVPVYQETAASDADDE